MIGTFMGGVAAVALVPNLVNSPIALSFALARPGLRVLPLYLAAGPHAPGLHVHAGRIHGRDHRFSQRYRAGHDLRYRAVARRGDHAGHCLRDLGSHHLLSPQRAGLHQREDQRDSAGRRALGDRDLGAGRADRRAHSPPRQGSREIGRGNHRALYSVDPSAVRHRQPAAHHAGRERAAGPSVPASAVGQRSRGSPPCAERRRGHDPGYRRAVQPCPRLGRQWQQRYARGGAGAARSL